MWFRRSTTNVAIERLEETVRAVVEKVLVNATTDTNAAIRDLGTAVKLKQEIETLKIEKGRKEEEFARKEREVEHKVGLERKRQEFEVASAKREAILSVREENLKADRSRFEEQMKFHTDRMTQEVGYLKELVADMSKRLPSAEFLVEASIPKRRGR